MFRCNDMNDSTVPLGKTCPSCWASLQMTLIYSGLCSLVLLSNIIKMAYKMSLTVRNLRMNKAAAQQEDIFIPDVPYSCLNIQDIAQPSFGANDQCEVGK